MKKYMGSDTMVANALVQHEFKGTTIKTPFEKMRANAILNATNDDKGLSIINFNVTGFVKAHKFDDVFYILCLWSVEPLEKAPRKFGRYPEAGEQALKTRAKGLIDNLSNRRDLTHEFIDTLRDGMTKMIENQMSPLYSDDYHAQTA